MVYIRFYGSFSKLMPETGEDNFFESECGGMSIEEALKTFDFGVAKYTTLVNSVREDRSYILKDGDKLGVMPLLAGG